ncbi:MAG: hypothetical protein J5911_01960 [Clostridia bacterium]|nr:hypothetical protein [Clostridia bacterium]
MKKWQIIKAILYFALSILIIIFNNEIMPYVGILVGAVVCLYALEELLIAAAKRTLFNNAYLLSDGTVQLLIGAILFIVSSDIIKVCLVWGVWSIIRESKEFAEAIKSIVAKRWGVINALESVVVVVLSFFLVLEPKEEHARLHLFLLAAELAIVVLFYIAEQVRDKIVAKKGLSSDESIGKKDELTV